MTFFPVLPICSFLLCLFLIAQLSVHTWIACSIWIVHLFYLWYKA
ncbi:amino acid permease C-terminal domain-containing protein [Bacillus cihuensis]